MPKLKLTGFNCETLGNENRMLFAMPIIKTNKAFYMALTKDWSIKPLKNMAWIDADDIETRLDIDIDIVEGDIVLFFGKEYCRLHNELCTRDLLQDTSLDDTSYDKKGGFQLLTTTPKDAEENYASLLFQELLYKFDSSQLTDQSDVSTKYISMLSGIPATEEGEYKQYRIRKLFTELHNERDNKTIKNLKDYAAMSLNLNIEEIEKELIDVKQHINSSPVKSEALVGPISIFLNHIWLTNDNPQTQRTSL